MLGLRRQLRKGPGAIHGNRRALLRSCRRRGQFAKGTALGADLSNPPELVGEGIRLPDTDPFERDKDEADDDSPLPPMREGITYQECAVVYNLLKEKLGEDDLYWTVFDPTKDNEVIRGTLADDIAGIYGDVKQGLLTLKKGAADSRLIIWDWRLSFYSHWGDHATSALRTIHALLREKFEDGQSI